jgi:hypothetical protein
LAQSIPKDSKVQLAGSFETVNVLAKSITVQIPEGSIGNLNVGKAAGSTTVDLSKEASIMSLSRPLFTDFFENDGSALTKIH